MSRSCAGFPCGIGGQRVPRARIPITEFLPIAFLRTAMMSKTLIAVMTR